MNVEIRIARGRAELARVARFRHQAFVLEQELDYEALDESADAYSAILLAERGDELLGTLRLTRRSEGLLEDEQALCLDVWAREFLDCEMVQASRFVVARTHRGTEVHQHLIAAGYEHARQLGARLLFIDAPEALLRYYHRIGFRRFGSGYHHPKLGRLYFPLVTFMDDRDYFVRTRALLGRFTDVDRAERARAFFAEHFPGANQMGNGGATTPLADVTGRVSTT
jgi:predicted GNAT family N-acyltransferase